jgi:HK97 family phage portal protein
MKSLARRQVAAQKLAPALPPGFGAGWTNVAGGEPGASPRQIENFLNTYGGERDSITWVYACTSLIASSLAAFPWKPIDQKTMYWGKPTVIDEPPPALVNFLSKPNDEMTYFDFVERLATDLELAGNSYWLQDQKNMFGEPLESLWLRPDKVRVAIHKDGPERGRKAGYIWSPAGVPVFLELDEVVHYKAGPHPKSAFYGMGTVEAILRTLDGEVAQAEHVVSFFQNGAFISGVLTTEMQLTEDTIQNLKRQFQSEYLGSNNAYKLLIAEQGLKYDPTSMPPQALGVDQLRILNKAEILSGFGVPEDLLGGVNNNQNRGLEDSQHIFNLKTMLPKAKRFSERTNLSLLAPWPQTGIMLDTSYPEPLSVKVKRARESVGTGTTIDELREMQEKAPLDEEWSKKPLIPSTVIFGDNPQAGDPAAGRLPSGPRSGREGGGPQQAVGPRAAPTQLQSHRTAVSAQKDLEGLIAQNSKEMRQLGLSTLQGSMTNFFIGQKNRVARAMDAFGPVQKGKRDKKELNISQIWDDQIEDAQLTKAYLEQMDALARTAIAVPAKELESDFEWVNSRPEVKELRDSLTSQVKRINEFTRKEIEDVISTGLSRSYSVHQILNGFLDEKYVGVSGVFDKALQSRVVTIAQTETSIVQNAALLLVYRDAGFKHVKVLDSQQDGGGEIWDLLKAAQNLIAHPNCSRTFVPVEEEAE